MQIRPPIFVIVLPAMAATVAQAAVTRDGGGASEFITVAGIIAVLLLCAFRLSRVARFAALKRLRRRRDDSRSGRALAPVPVSPSRRLAY